MVIRFDRPDIAYEQGLYEAISKALERRPQAAFDLVAMAARPNDIGQFSANQDQSRRNIERVLRSLTEMGLPAERVALSSATGADLAANEIRIYLR